MSARTELIDGLKSKYKDPITLSQYLLNKYGEKYNTEYNTENNKDSTETLQRETEISETRYLTFECDDKVNLSLIENLLNSIEYYKEKFSDNKNEVSINKLVNKYIDGLNKIKCRSDLYKSENVAEKYVTILKQTLMKLWDNTGDIVKKYLNDNSIHTEEYENGHRLSDEEFGMLDGRFLKALAVKTDNINDRYKVIKMSQPIIKIYYRDDDNDEVEYKIIDGICSYYK